MTNIKNFVESIEVPNTAKVVCYVIGDVDVEIESYSCAELEQFILGLKPNSPKAIITICYVLGLYARWLQNQGYVEDDIFHRTIQSLDKQKLWERAKPTARKKFVSHGRYTQVINDIKCYEEFNPLYYQTLFKAVYEGIYNDDLSVLKNLRASDIDGNTVTLHEDSGHTYEIGISEELASELRALSLIDIWERRNRYGLCRVNMRGLYYDSVFRIEDRKTAADNSYRFALYAKLRKIGKEYLEFSVLPFQLYISGIMYRIKTELEANGIPIEVAFADNSRNKKAREIVLRELVRCNYTTDVGNFREIVKGHLDSF